MSWQQTRRGTVIASSEDDASPTPTPEFAYLRRAQITHDTFDAYRNVWLALESGLQRVLPKSGREKQWLQAALELTDKQFEGGFGQVWPDFVDRHYAAYRCALFHASRDGRRVPGSFADLRQVREALAELAQLTVQLVQRVLGWESHIALTLQQGWDHTVDVLGGLTIGVTDDDRDDDPSMTAPAQPGRLIDEVAPDHVRVVREPFERTFTGRLRVADMQVRTVNATFQRVADDDNRPLLMAWGRTAALACDGLSHVEVETTWHATHHALVRVEYPR